jgi:hypothetical protein
VAAPEHFYGVFPENSPISTLKANDFFSLDKYGSQYPMIPIRNAA